MSYKVKLFTTSDGVTDDIHELVKSVVKKSKHDTLRGVQEVTIIVHEAGKDVKITLHVWDRLEGEIGSIALK